MCSIFVTYEHLAKLSRYSPCLHFTRKTTELCTTRVQLFKCVYTSTNPPTSLHPSPNPVMTFEKEFTSLIFAIFLAER